MGLTLVEKQRASFIADQRRVIEKNLLKKLKSAHTIHKKTIIIEKSLYYK